MQNEPSTAQCNKQGSSPVYLLPATLWRKTDPQTGVVRINHLEDGHNTTGHPTSKCADHNKLWKNGIWIPELLWIHANTRQLVRKAFDDTI